jgi:hypothetical protein
MSPRVVAQRVKQYTAFEVAQLVKRLASLPCGS